MKVGELIEEIKYCGCSNPEKIFQLYEEAKKLSDGDSRKLRYSGYGEALDMLYSAALEMKKKGTWDSYVEDCKNRKKKTAEEIKRELMEKYLSI